MIIPQPFFPVKPQRISKPPWNEKKEREQGWNTGGQYAPREVKTAEKVRIMIMKSSIMDQLRT
jgi:hypothetical protein